MELVSLWPCGFSLKILINEVIDQFRGAKVTSRIQLNLLTLKQISCIGKVFANNLRICVNSVVVLIFEELVLYLELLNKLSLWFFLL